MEDHKKYGVTELMLGAIGTLSIDVVCGLIDLTGIGMAIAPVLQAGTSFALTLWAKSKGDTGSLKVGRQISKYAASAIPLVPTTLLAFAIEAYMHNHPSRATAAVAGLTEKHA